MQMNRIAELTWKRPKLVLVLVGLFVLVAGAVGKDVESHLKAAGFTDSASESERATALLTERLGFDPNPAIVLVVREPGGGRLDVSSPAVRREVARLSGEIGRLDHVGRVVNPLRDRGAGARLIAADGRSLVVSAHLDTADIEDTGGVVAEAVAPIAAESSLDVAMGGFAPGFNETNDQTREDLTKSELIAFPVLALLLLFVFRGVVAAAIPLLIGVISIVGTLLVLRVMAGFVDTSLFALNIATGLSLGLAVDYALLLVSRYREELAAHGHSREAHVRTVRTAGRTALFSGLTVAAAMAALIVMPQRFLYSMAVAGTAVALLSALIALLVVPSILALLGTRIDALSIRRGPAVSDTSDGWYRVARGVMRRPVAVALASSALMLAAAAPLLWTTLTGPSAEAVPPGQPSYDAYRYVEAHYPRDVSEAVTVAVDGATGEARLSSFRQRIEAVEGVTGGGPFAAASEDVAYANFALAGPALDGASQDAVRQIRDLQPPGGGSSLVSGNTARFIDQKESLASHAPAVVGIIVLTTLVVLFLLTGSVLLPLKTLVMNALTLGTTLGVLVLAFQEGWLKSPLDYTGPAAVEVTSLVFLFAVIFGLATDYAVLVMARIKERRDCGDSNEEAVATGIGRTGRVITAAALAIAVVFLAFAVSSVFFVKQIAIGMAVGVLVDATIVRALLVPSLMRLFGEWNWWAPRPLRRLQERFGFSEGEGPHTAGPRPASESGS
ncbi:MAG TPA: efflux RND transporter permease subunit [Solirubrobacterales bacterium]|nr:efflux RND transporter permease subunit [Solirubrobacterales bacterium]